MERLRSLKPTCFLSSDSNQGRQKSTRCSGLQRHRQGRAATQRSSRGQDEKGKSVSAKHKRDLAKIFDYRDSRAGLSIVAWQPLDCYHREHLKQVVGWIVRDTCRDASSRRLKLLR